MVHTGFTKRDFLTGLWSTVRLPLQILLVGGSVLVLLRIAEVVATGASVSTALTALMGAAPASGFIGILIFLVGIGFAVFLWWLASRYFALLTAEKIDKDVVSALKDLPLALPEGTVRAVLALVVGVVGLPILLFSDVLNLDADAKGYVNGIIAGVFGFYFGTRTSGVPTQAMNQIGAAQREIGQALATVAQANDRVAQAQQGEMEATRGSQLATAVDQLGRHIGLASALVNAIAPALPPGLVPPGLKDLLDKTQTVFDVAKTLTGETANDEQVKQANDAAAALIGAGGSGTSVIGSLLGSASALLPAAGLALGPLSGIALMLGVGWRLGSAEFQRWRARVLAAPFANGLVEFGTVTPDDALAALSSSPLFQSAFAPVRNEPGFGTALADAVLRDDAADRLWAAYGQSAPDHPVLFDTREQLARGLIEFRRTLLEDRARTDISDDMVKTVAASLAEAATPALRPPSDPGRLTADNLNALIRAAGDAAAAPAPPVNAQAAFDALVILVGHARQDKIDLPAALAELKP